jgi:preprotein translocase subunit YajC
MNTPILPLHALEAFETSGARIPTRDSQAEATAAAPGAAATSDATQEAATEGTQDNGSPAIFDTLLVPGALCVLVFWFLIIRPEKRQRKAREQMLEEMKKGDEVVTSGGMHGKVTLVKDDVITLQVADGVRLRFARSAVQTINGTEEPAKKDDDQDSTSD